MEDEDLRYGKSLGATGHHENRLIALQWADELYSTRFRGVELATTRTGMVSITGLFDPISIDAVSYTHLDVYKRQAQDRGNHRSEHRREEAEGADHGFHAVHHLQGRGKRRHLPFRYGEKSLRAEGSVRVRRCV